MNNIDKIDEINQKIAMLVNEIKKQSEELDFELSSNISDNIYRLRKELDTIPFIDELNRRKITYNIANLNNIVVKNGSASDTVLIKKIVDLWSNFDKIKKLTMEKNNIIIRCLSNVMNNEILESITIDMSDEENLKMTRINKSKKELFDNYKKAKEYLENSITIKEVYNISEKLLEELFDSYLGFDININDNKEKLTRS